MHDILAFRANCYVITAARWRHGDSNYAMCLDAEIQFPVIDMHLSHANVLGLLLLLLLLLFHFKSLIYLLKYRFCLRYGCHPQRCHICVTTSNKYSIGPQYMKVRHLQVFWTTAPFRQVNMAFWRGFIASTLRAINFCGILRVVIRYFKQ